MNLSFNHSTFHQYCDEVCRADADLDGILQKHGYPPMWSRANTFETLVHIILEQQVSLASALSALNKLRERVQEITPARVSLLTDEELRACYFSRQKSLYVKHLAGHIISAKLNLEELAQRSDDDIRKQLCTVKGIGDWTVDVYLMFVLQRADVFPVGDLAAVNALKKVKGLPASVHRDELLLVAEGWKPYRTIATMLLWHFYLEERKRV
jgi:DNA-3-methyladenine glycosylase II